jgi:hypothetical protein
MSIQHTTAVYECDQFQGITRALLTALAYFAYDKGPYPRGFPDPGFGWGYRGEDFFMKCLNMNRRQTISGCFTELEESGAIQRKRRFHNTSLTFVDLDWLLAHKRTHDTESVTSVEGMLPERTQTTQSVTSVPTQSVTTLGHVERDNHLTQSVTRSTSSLIVNVQRRVHLDNNPANITCGGQKIGTGDGSSESLESLETEPTAPTTSKPLQENRPPAPGRCHRKSYGSSQCEFCGSTISRPELCPKRHPENTINAGAVDRHEFRKSTSACDKCGLAFWVWANTEDPVRYKNYAAMPCAQEVAVVSNVSDIEGLEASLQPKSPSLDAHFCLKCNATWRVDDPNYNPNKPHVCEDFDWHCTSCGLNFKGNEHDVDACAAEHKDDEVFAVDDVKDTDGLVEEIPYR